MMFENKESVQLLNTAIIKSKENRINTSYEERLAAICDDPAIKYLSQAISNLSQNEKISRDQAAIKITELIRELDSIWNDYITMEGIENCQDVFITMTGKKDEEVLGYITNVIIEKKSQV